MSFMESKNLEKKGYRDVSNDFELQTYDCYKIIATKLSIYLLPKKNEQYGKDIIREKSIQNSTITHKTRTNIVRGMG